MMTIKQPTRGLLLGACATLAFGLSSLEACTSLLLPTDNGGSVYGRTMEFGVDLEAAGVVIPRNYAYTATGPNQKSGKTWTSKYAAMGMNVFGMPYLVDGMNEKGLTGGILYFPGYAQYTPQASADAAKSMGGWEFLTWVLGNFATVEEVKAALDGVQVIDVELEAAKFVLPLHYTLHDASGKSIVIEPTGGTLKVFDNPYGVMTNSPTFDWHLTNMRNYVKLSSMNAHPMKIAGQEVASFGQGSGWLGIPGDPTPPSRFIRALAFSMTTDIKPNGIESVRLVEHIMNNFDIPYGSIREEGSKEWDYTQWTVIADIQDQVYYVKTYENQNLLSFALADFDLDAKTIATAPLKEDLVAPSLFPGK